MTLADATLIEPQIEGLIAQATDGHAHVLSLDKWSRVKVRAGKHGPEFLYWKTAGNPPSRRACEVLALAAGVIAPIWTQRECEGRDGYLLQDRADHAAAALCAHTWGETLFLDGKTFSGLEKKCAVCGSSRTTVTKRRGKGGAEFDYNGGGLLQAAFDRYTLRGPIPHTLSPEERTAVLARLSALPAPAEAVPAPTPTRAPAAVLTGPVCGLCGHAQVTEYLDIECLLGWEEHDPLAYVEFYPKGPDGKRIPLTAQERASEKWRGLNTRFVLSAFQAKNVQTLPHGDARLPIMSPGAKCGCRKDRFRPYRGAPDELRAAMFARIAERAAK